MVLPKPKRRKLQTGTNSSQVSPQLDDDEIEFCDSFLLDPNAFIGQQDARVRKSTNACVLSRQHVAPSLSAIDDEENTSVSYLSECDVGYNDNDDIFCPLSGNDPLSLTTGAGVISCAGRSSTCSSSRATQSQKGTTTSRSTSQTERTDSAAGGDDLCMNKNAVAARENRRKKKTYIQSLEATHKTLSLENEKLKKNLEFAENEVNELKHEVSYLKGILANQSSLSSLLKNIVKTPGLHFTSSFDVQTPKAEKYSIKDVKHYSSANINGNKMHSRSKLTDITHNFKSEQPNAQFKCSDSKNSIKYIELKSEESGSETADSLSSLAVENIADTTLEPKSNLLTDSSRCEANNLDDLKPVTKHVKRPSTSNMDKTTPNIIKKAYAHPVATSEVLTLPAKTSAKKRGVKRKKGKKPVIHSLRA